MLIELHEDPKNIATFPELCTECINTLNVLRKNSGTTRLTIVFGPMSPRNGRTFEENMRALREAGERLHHADWSVLELTSFQRTIDRIGSTMPQEVFSLEVLDNFTLPLIRSKRLHTLHFMQNYKESLGAVKEYEEALLHYDPWRIRFV